MQNTQRTTLNTLVIVYYLFDHVVVENIKCVCIFICIFILKIISNFVSH